MVTLNDLQVAGEYRGLLSLEKLIGKRIQDVYCYVSGFSADEPLLGVSEIIFEDGSKLNACGEYDFPYLDTYTAYPQSNMDTETLQRLREESE